MKTNNTKQRKTNNATQHYSDASTTHYIGSKAKKSIVTLTIDGKRYITLSRYAEIKGITEWYVGKLCRLGKVECIKVGNYWFIHK